MDWAFLVEVKSYFDPTALLDNHVLSLLFPEGKGNLLYIFDPNDVQQVYRNEGKYPYRGQLFSPFKMLRSTRPGLLFWLLLTGSSVGDASLIYFGDTAMLVVLLSKIFFHYLLTSSKLLLLIHQSGNVDLSWVGKVHRSILILLLLLLIKILGQGYFRWLGYQRYQWFQKVIQSQYDAILQVCAEYDVYSIDHSNNFLL